MTLLLCIGSNHLWTSLKYLVFVCKLPWWPNRFKRRRLKKKDGPMKVLLFLGDEFPCIQDGQISFKFDARKGILPIYRMMPNVMGFLGWFAVIEALFSVALLELCIACADAHYIGRLYSWWCLIDIDCVLSHVKVESGLSISDMRNRITPFEKIAVQNRGVFKVHKFSRAASSTRLSKE